MIQWAQAQDLVKVHSFNILNFISVHFNSVAQSCLTFVTLWTVALQASLSITNSWSLLKLMSIVLVMPSNHLILGHPLLLLTSIFPSIKVISNESVLHIRWPKYWNFSFSISPSSEYWGLISFRINWLDLLAVQATFKSLLKNISSLALSLIYGPALTSIQDCWKNHSFISMSVCLQSYVFAF